MFQGGFGAFGMQLTVFLDIAGQVQFTGLVMVYFGYLDVGHIKRLPALSGICAHPLL